LGALADGMFSTRFAVLWSRYLFGFADLYADLRPSLA
jgi:hypothetical protein